MKNVTTYLFVEIWWVFITRWMMPLFFVISVISICYGIRKSRDWKRFYTDKFSRLMIPFFFVSLTYSVLQVYLERLSHGRFVGSLFQFVQIFFRGVYTGLNNHTGNFSHFSQHLWYRNYSAQYQLSAKGMVFQEPLKPGMASGAPRIDLCVSWNTIPLAWPFLNSAE